MARVRWRYWMEKAKETMAFYQREFGIRPLIRMVFYNLTKFDPGLPNTEYHNKYFDWLLVKARQTGEISWDAFAEDAERWPAGGDEPYLTVDQAIALGLDYFRDLPSSYRLLFWWGQDNQVVVMAEKTGERAGIVLADGGYHTAANLEAGKRRGQLLVIGERYQGTVQDRYFKDRFVYDGMTDSYLCPMANDFPSEGSAGPDTPAEGRSVSAELQEPFAVPARPSGSAPGMDMQDGRSGSAPRMPCCADTESG